MMVNTQDWFVICTFPQLHHLHCRLSHNSSKSWCLLSSSDNGSWSEIQCGRIWRSVQNTGWCRPQKHKLGNYLDANFSRTYALKVWYEFERKPCWTCLWWVWIIFRSIPRIIQSSLSAPPWWNMYTCIATGGRLYIVVVVVGGHQQNPIQQM